MTDTITIGVDPGRKGAIAILHGGRLLDVFDIPFIDIGGYVCVCSCVFRGKSRRALNDAARSVAIGNKARFVIEKPTPRRGEGVTSAFTSGLGFGGLLTAMDDLFPRGVTVVTSQKWKKAMGCAADKQTSMREACARFPEQKHMFYGPRGGALDGRAEAALIGLYGAMYL